MDEGILNIGYLLFNFLLEALNHRSARMSAGTTDHFVCLNGRNSIMDTLGMIRQIGCA
jgi:hypothetical protein